jgi:hypothetical protein
MLKTRAGEVVGIDIEPLTYTIDEVARALGVEPQQVVLGEGEAADGRRGHGGAAGEATALLGGSHEVRIKKAQFQTRCWFEFDALRPSASLDGVNRLFGFMHNLIVDTAREAIASHHHGPLRGGHLKK